MATIQQITVMTRQPTTIDAVVVDACVTYTDNLKNTITDHPVEEGSNISDHCRPDADNVTLECYISDTPGSREQQARAVASGSATFNPVTGDDPAAQPGYSNSQYLALKKLRDEGTLFTVLTGLRRYVSMAIETMSTPKTTKDIDALHFTVNCKQIRIVKNKLTRKVVAKDPRAGDKVKNGNKTPRKVVPTEKTATKLQRAFKGSTGLADRVLGALGGG